MARSESQGGEKDEGDGQEGDTQRPWREGRHDRTLLVKVRRSENSGWGWVVQAGGERNKARTGE